MKDLDVLKRYGGRYVASGHEDKSGALAGDFYYLPAGSLDFGSGLVEKHVDRSNIAAEGHLAGKYVPRLGDIHLLIEENGRAAGLEKEFKPVGCISAYVED